MVVMNKIHLFRHDRPEDTFHGWLWSICRLEILRNVERCAKGPVATPAAQLEGHVPTAVELPESICRLNEDRQLVYQRALEVMKNEFEERTWQAFWKVSVEGLAPAVVADMQGMTVGAVYNAKYKVLRKLRLELQGLL